MRRTRHLRRAVTVAAAAAVLAGCTNAVVGTPVSVFSDPFKVGGLEAVDGPTGLRPNAKAESREVTGTD
ncbi:MAG: peptidase, partial [Mycobacteriaceae bacterium]|nr:peptidase [Mycobacteriaceae bacterium]